MISYLFLLSSVRSFRLSDVSIDINLLVHDGMLLSRSIWILYTQGW
jgi:hypothetical protein